MPKGAVNYRGRVSESTHFPNPAADTCGRVEPIGLCNFKRANHVEECGGGGAR